MSERRDKPRHMTMLPGAGSLARAGDWIGVQRLRDGCQVVCGNPDGSRAVSRSRGPARTNELLTAAIAYYEEALKHTRPNGLILIDNVLWSGRIFDRADLDRETIGVREINELVAKDTRVEAVLLTFADWPTIGRKKEQSRFSPR